MYLQSVINKYSLVLFLILTFVMWPGIKLAAQSDDQLVQVLLRKGILSPEDFKQLDAAHSSGATDKILTKILFDKGLLTSTEYAQLTQTLLPTPVSTLPVKPALVQAVSQTPPIKPPTISSASSVHSPAASVSVVPMKPAVGSAISAIAPIRVLPVGGIGRDTFASAFKVNGVGFAPYGMLRATSIEDSSSPYGDDFPLPGFLADGGPDASPEFHLKARSSRIGFNFAWFDANPKWDISGKMEMDFEGNFNRSDNRNISTIRSNNPSLRLAWARMDYRVSGSDTISALFGQDWSPFGSSTLPNILETTSYGIGFGILYERTPQMRLGYTRKLSGVQIMPEFAIAVPAVGLQPAAANLSQQLGYGERQGADSNRPELEGRLVTQWQLDHAAGVTPAQLIISFELGNRTATVLSTSIPAVYQNTFTTGAKGSSHTDGWDFEWQLPTRYLTLVGKVYGGAGLRYFFVNQLYSYFNDTAGLSNLAALSSIDGSSTVVLGTTTAGTQVVAPQRPIRTAGGWAQVGLPLSRIFGANPSGHNAGWSLYALYSVDQAKTRDLLRLGTTGTRRYSTMAVGTLNYSMNRWVTFSFEQSLYTTHANPEIARPLFKGIPANEWNDIRSEFGPTFTF